MDTAAALLGLGVTQHPSAPIDVADGLTLVSTATGTARVVVVDAGRLDDLADTPAGVLLVVLRGPCYLGLRSIVMSDLQPDGIVLLSRGGPQPDPPRRRGRVRRARRRPDPRHLERRPHDRRRPARHPRARALASSHPSATTSPPPSPSPTPLLDPAPSARLQHPSTPIPATTLEPLRPHPDPSTPTTPSKIATDMPVALSATGRAAPVVSRTRAGDAPFPPEATLPEGQC